MYRETIQNLIADSLLEIDTEIRVKGRRPTMANSQFLINREQGDWAEQIVYKAINENSKEYFAIRYGRSDHIAADEESFGEFYEKYQNELNSIGKKPDILIFRLSDFSDRKIEVENDEHIKKAVAALEIRSSSFLIEKYIDFMNNTQRDALERCRDVCHNILSGELAGILKRKKPVIYNMILRATDDTFYELDFRLPAWSATQEVRDLKELLRELKENIKILGIIYLLPQKRRLNPSFPYK